MWLHNLFGLFDFLDFFVLLYTRCCCKKTHPGSPGWSTGFGTSLGLPSQALRGRRSATDGTTIFQALFNQQLTTDKTPNQSSHVPTTPAPPKISPPSEIQCL